MKKRLSLLLLVFPLVAGALYLRSLASWRPKRVFTGKGTVYGLTFSGDGKTLLVLQWSPSMSGSGTGTALDVQNDYVLRWQRNHILSTNNPSQFFADDSHLLLRTNKGTLELAPTTGQVLRKYQYDPGPAVMSPNGRWAAYFGFLTPSGKLTGHVFIVPSNANDSSMQLKENAKMLDSVAHSGNALSFSPDGKTFVVGVGERNGTHLDFYDTRTWKRTQSCYDLKLHSSKPWVCTPLQWSHDGHRLLSSWCHNTQEWERMGTRIRQIQDGRIVGDSSFSGRNSVHLQLQNDGTLLDWQLPGDVIEQKKPEPVDSKVLLRLADDHVTAIALSPDESYFVAGTQSGHIYRQRLK